MDEKKRKTAFYAPLRFILLMFIAAVSIGCLVVTCLGYFQSLENRSLAEKLQTLGITDHTIKSIVIRKVPAAALIKGKIKPYGSSTIRDVWELILRSIVIKRKLAPHFVPLLEVEIYIDNSENPSTRLFVNDVDAVQIDDEEVLFSAPGIYLKLEKILKEYPFVRVNNE